MHPVQLTRDKISHHARNDPTTGELHNCRCSTKPVLVRARLGDLGERALGFFHLGTGLWLMYLMFATVLNLVNGYSLPL